MQSVFARYLVYNITILQTTDITVSCNVWSMLYVTSSNGECMCAAFRPLYVTEEQANKCEYPVSSMVRFRKKLVQLLIRSQNSGGLTIRSLIYIPDALPITHLLRCHHDNSQQITATMLRPQRTDQMTKLRAQHIISAN